MGRDRFVVRRRGYKHALFVLVVAMFLSACATTTQELPPASPASAKKAVSALHELFPPSGTLEQKVLIHVRGKDLILFGRATFTGRRTVRAVAVDQFGEVVFDFEITAQGAMIHKAPARVSKRVLLKGPVAGLRDAFLMPPGSPDVRVARRDVVQLRWLSAGDEVSYLVDVEAGRVLSCVQRRGRRVVRRIIFDSNESGCKTPRRIRITDCAEHYRIEASSLQLCEGDELLTDCEGPGTD